MPMRRSVDKKGMEHIRNLLSDDLVTKVGWFSDSDYFDVTKKDTSVASVAATQEFGDPINHIPPRPFMRPTIKARERRWLTLAKNLFKEVVKEKITLEQAMDLLGAFAVGDIKTKISAIRSPALAKSTVRRRIAELAENTKITKSIRKPLVHTGTMLNTLTHVTQLKMYDLD